MNACTHTRTRTTHTHASTHLQLVPNAGHAAQIHAIVGDSEDLVDHGLESPLHEKGCHGVVTAVEDEKEWGHVCASEFEEFCFLTHSPLLRG
jgi:hypothetical protein